MPVIGIGTSGASSDILIAAVKSAIKNGYRLIDTAAAYNNEEAIGEALFQCFSENLVTQSALKESLQKLRLDYIDLYLAHNPCPTDPNVKIEDIWKGLEMLYEKKLAKSIGLSNFNVQQLQRILNIAKIPIHCLQIELHLYFQQKEMIEFCKKHGITVMAYAPLGSPNRSFYKEKIESDQSESLIPLENPLITELAKKHAKTPARILLRHLIQNGFNVIPKSTNETRIKENLDVFDFELSDDEIKKLNNVPQKSRTFWLNFLAPHPEDPFKDEREEI
uniref:NADP-dependent oxidoreductase domain-containing protein n=1 Tax=Panagrolaimus sp. ES5 TaxID=591445 RepID=A0AC34FVN3_9BILA